MCVIGDELAALRVARLRMRNYVGIAVDAQVLNPAASLAAAGVFKRDDLVSAGVVEIEHVVGLAFKEKGGAAVGLEPEAKPEEGAVAVAIPVAAHKAGVAGE